MWRAPAGRGREGSTVSGMRQCRLLKDIGRRAGKSGSRAVRWWAGCDNEQLLLPGGAAGTEVICPAREGGVYGGVV